MPTASRSASFPCIGGRIAPPRIIIIRNAAPWVVYFPSPAIAREKIHGHIIEHARPQLRSAYTAIIPEVFRATIVARSPNAPNTDRVRAGLSRVRRKAAIWAKMQMKYHLRGAIS